MYSTDLIHIFDAKNRFTFIIRFLRSYSRFIGIQNAEESDKHIPIDSDGPSKVLSPAAESKVKTACLIWKRFPLTTKHIYSKFTIREGFEFWINPLVSYDYERPFLGSQKY